MDAVVAAVAFGLTSGLVVSIVAVALGERARSLLRLACPPGLRPAVAWCLGCWLLSLGVVALGLAGAHRPAPLLGGLLAAAALGRWRAAWRVTRRLAPIGLAAAPLLVVALAPPFFYDAWVYHLGLPWQALLDGRSSGQPEDLFAAFPPLARSIFAIPLAAGALRAPAVIHLFGFCAGGAGVVALARRLGAAGPLAVAAGCAVLYLPVAPLAAAFPAAEAWSVAGIVATLAVALAGRRASSAAPLAGLLAGIVAAARLQGLGWGVVAAAVVAGRSPRRIADLGRFVLGAVAGSSPWWIRNGALLGDPLAPLFWTRPGMETLWRDAASQARLASGPADLLARAAGALGGVSWILLPLIVAGVVAVGLRKRAAGAWVVAAALAGVAGWVLTGALGRFLLPSLALLVAAAASGRRRVGTVVGALALAVVLVPGGARAAQLFRRLGGFSVLGPPGQVYASLVVSNPYPGFLACDSLPPDARVFFVGEPRGFLFPRAFRTSSQHDPSPLRALLDHPATPEQVAARLVERGFTHLLVHVPELRRLGERYPVLPWSDAQSRSRFVELTRCLEPAVVSERELVVYALERCAGRPAPPAGRD